MQAFRLVVGDSDMLAYLSMMALRLVLRPKSRDAFGFHARSTRPV
jgi:hypothetical protein